ncbi:MAG TPA: CPBP family intramembrane glutamic endopeptidase [Actinomycetes bacterium]|nr:CPBP family intramembrane glutamic endopeptidase [Actinomycetes bacterium]
MTRRQIKFELFIVLAISLGYSGVVAFVNLLQDYTTSHGHLNRLITAPLIGSRAPNRHWFDLVYQLLAIGRALIPVLLVCYLLSLSKEKPLQVLGLDASQPKRDILRGTALAALIGGSGLALYLFARHIGMNLSVVATDLPPVFWRIPILVLAAAENALLEEAVVLGYVIHRLDQLGWRPWSQVAFSAVLRGSYHLYQGFGGFVGNAVMGVIFGRLYQRWGRVMPMFIAHTLIDSVAFVGYVLLKGHVSWL